MYVDESGVESVYDKTKFFVTAGAIFHEDDLETMKTTIRDYVKQNFTGNYANAEIHLQQLFKAKGKFFGLTQSQKLALLNSLYSTISGLPFIGIVIGIDKQKFVSKHSDPNDILDYGHMLLVERFDNFLVEHDEKGIIRIDRTTGSTEIKLNTKDTKILKIINKIRKNGTRWQAPAKSIVEEPAFLSSHIRIGLQIADAVAYCANRHVNNNSDFDSFWKIIYSKLRSSSIGVVTGYGYRIYPK